MASAEMADLPVSEVRVGGVAVCRRHRCPEWGTQVCWILFMFLGFWEFVTLGPLAVTILMDFAYWPHQVLNKWVLSNSGDCSARPWRTGIFQQRPIGLCWFILSKLKNYLITVAMERPEAVLRNQGAWKGSVSGACRDGVRQRSRDENHVSLTLKPAPTQVS